MANSKFSRFVYNVIDVAGINDDIKCKKIECMKQWQSFLSHCTSSITIVTGSSSEGIIPMLASDLDTMTVSNNIICLDVDSSESDDLLEILVAEYEDTPPGYVKVRHSVSRGLEYQNISTVSQFSLKSYWYGSINVAPFLSNKHFREVDRLSDFMTRHLNFTKEYNGPARTEHYDILGIGYNWLCDFDYVLAIRYYNISILTEWSTRTRYYDWPTDELIHKVSSMEGFILPVGERESETQHLEWRISHVTAEKTLIKSLNSCQYKLYVVLKLFSKHVFSSASKSFSSYMVKNVVLWMTETNPNHLFTPDNFIAQLLQCLNFIKQCLICNHLPSYMLPKKNLIAGRIVGHEKREFIYFLSSLTDEGAAVIYRLPKLAECLTYVSIHPDIFARAGIWRHCVEQQLISLFITTMRRDFLLDANKFFVNGDLLSLVLRLAREERVVIELLKFCKLVIPDINFFSNRQINKIALKRFQLVNKCFCLE